MPQHRYHFCQPKVCNKEGAQYLFADNPGITHNVNKPVFASIGEAPRTGTVSNLLDQSSANLDGLDLGTDLDLHDNTSFSSFSASAKGSSANDLSSHELEGLQHGICLDSDWTCNFQDPPPRASTADEPLTPLTVDDYDRQQIAQAWLVLCVKQNLDPTDNVNDMQLLAQLLRTTHLHVHVLFELLKNSMRAQPGACCENSDDIRGIAEPASTRQDRKTMFVTKYASDATVKSFKAQGKGGKFRCTWGCPFSSPRRYEWKRHEECHRPQRFWICDQCFSPTQDPLVFHRLDKLRSHLRSKTGCKNKSSDRLSAIEKRSEVHYSNPCEATCWHTRLDDTHACGHAFSSWKERLQHWTTHSTNESQDSDPFNAIGSIEDADENGDAGASGGSSSEGSFAGNGLGSGFSNAFNFDSSDDVYNYLGSSGTWSYQRSRSTSATSLSDPVRAMSATKVASGTRNSSAKALVSCDQASIKSAAIPGMTVEDELTSDIAEVKATSQPKSTTTVYGRKDGERSLSESARSNTSESQRREVERLTPRYHHTSSEEELKPHTLGIDPVTYLGDAPNWSTRYNKGADDSRIWQVARATSAVLLYLQTSDAKVNGRYKAFKDGGIRENNPGEAAISKFDSLYEGVLNKPADLLSVGTDRQDTKHDGFATLQQPDPGAQPCLARMQLAPCRPLVGGLFQPRNTGSDRAMDGPEFVKKPRHRGSTGPRYYCNVSDCLQQYSFSTESELRHHTVSRHPHVPGVGVDWSPACGIGAASRSSLASMESRSRERYRTGSPKRLAVTAPPDHYMRDFFDDLHIPGPGDLACCRTSTVINRRPFSALHRAIEFGNLEIARLLLDHGAGVSASAEQDHSPVQLAVRHSNLAAVHLLLEAGCYLNNTASLHRMPRSPAVVQSEGSCPVIPV